MGSSDGRDSTVSHGQSREEERAAVRWFIGSLIVAVGLCVALYRIDEMLTHSTSEKRLGATLKELRSAQSGLRAQPIDERIQ